MPAELCPGQIYPSLIARFLSNMIVDPSISFESRVVNVTSDVSLFEGKDAAYI